MTDLEARNCPLKQCLTEAAEEGCPTLQYFPPPPLPPLCALVAISPFLDENTILWLKESNEFHL